MTAYKITATATDSTGVCISSDTAEALGEAYGRIYLTRDRAEDVAEDLASELPEGYDTTRYSVEAVDIDDIADGELYDVASVAAVMHALPEGHNVADYFDPNGRYRGADDSGIGITIRS